jgi:transcriptional regulator with XRE-family HTH domain
MMMILKVLASHIRRHRLARGLSQSALAEKAAVSHAYISRLEAGAVARPSAAMLLRIAQALDLDAATLWEDVGGDTAANQPDLTLGTLQQQLARLASAIGSLRGLPVYRSRRDGGARYGGKGQPVGVLVLEDPHVPPHRWAMVIRDDTLAHERIRAGDYVIVDPDLPPRKHSLVAYGQDDDLWVTRYAVARHAGGRVPEVSEPDCARPHGADGRVLGTVYAVVRLPRGHEA